ncbi:hypothetical protein TSUD_90650 [Trifolium subterraneum]|uniref:Uncharacterized protein n=1 Tax=Trifolium subterraneum TaxID=3900 RepID=A0A2Z6P0S3_TRISU|nr:hypothetical protein TSUD_90650 [Trifolium subterraneum]
MVPVLPAKPAPMKPGPSAAADRSFAQVLNASCEVQFASFEDMRLAWSTGTVNLKPGVIRFSKWTNDFKVPVVYESKQIIKVKLEASRVMKYVPKAAASNAQLAKGNTANGTTARAENIEKEKIETAALEPPRPVDRAKCGWLCLNK